MSGSAISYGSCKVSIPVLIVYADFAKIGAVPIAD
jgi:hypothetical protein